MGWVGFCEGGCEYCTEPERAGMGGGVPRVWTITDWVLLHGSDDSWGGLIFGGSLEGGDIDVTDVLRAGIDGSFWCCVVAAAAAIGCMASAFTGTGWPACFNGTWMGFGWDGGDWLGLLIIVCNLEVGCCGKWCCVCGTLCCIWGEGDACICLCCICGDFLLSVPAAT